MTKTKSSLLLSAISLLLCVSMLIGTTFAWFTDSVTSSGNKIESGTLKVDLELLDKENGEWISLKNANTKLFDYDKWEPGYTEIKILRVQNEGTLALKWVAQFVSDAELSKLADVIDVYVTTETLNAYPTDRDVVKNWTKAGTVAEFVNTIATTTKGTLLANDGVTGSGPDEAYLGIALKMREEANNDYQNLDLGGEFDIRIFATQLNSEKDSIDEDYDEDSVYADAYVTSAEEFAAAIAEGGTVALMNDLTITDVPFTVAAGESLEIDLNGNELIGIATTSSASKLVNVSAGATLALKNGTVTFGATTPDTNWGGEGQPAFPGYANNAINCSGTLIIDGATVVNTTEPGGASYAIDCYPGANLIINDGIIDGNGKVAIRTFANSKTTPISITVNGGKVMGKRAVWIQLPSGDETVAPKVNLTVNGGELISTDPTGNLAVYSYSYGNSFDGVNIALNGGEIYGDVALGGGGKTVNDVTTKYGKETITVDDNCTLYGDVYSYNDNAGFERIEAEEKKVVAAETDTLATAVNIENATVRVMEGTYSFPATSSFKAGVTLECEEGTVFSNGTNAISLDVNGATVIGATFSGEGERTITGTINGTFKNCVFEGDRGLRYCYAGETTVFEDCVFDGEVYGAHFDAGTNPVTFKRCTFSGFNAFGSAITLLTLEDCIFKSTGKSDYNGVNLWGETKLTNCEFIFDGEASTEWIGLNGADSNTIEFTGCVITDSDGNSTELTGDSDYFSNYETGDKVTVDGTEYTLA